MMITDTLLDLSRKAVPRLRETDGPCVEIEGAPGVFLCREGQEVPSSYIKLATFSLSEEDSEKFDIHTT